MSNGIMEKNLPVAESLGSGDKVRIVTSAGNSKQIDPSQIGGGGYFKVTTDYTSAPGTDDPTLDKTYNEIKSAFDGGKEIMVTEAVGEDGVLVYRFNGCFVRNGKYIVIVNDPQALAFSQYTLMFLADSPDGVLTLDSGSTPQ